MNGWLRRILLDHCGDELGWTIVLFDPQACNLNGPPQYLLTTTPSTPHHTNPISRDERSATECRLRLGWTILNISFGNVHDRKSTDANSSWELEND
jgi:hypothetical protein